MNRLLLSRFNATGKSNPTRTSSRSQTHKTKEAVSPETAPQLDSFWINPLFLARTSRCGRSPGRRRSTGTASSRSTCIFHAFFKFGVLIGSEDFFHFLIHSFTNFLNLGSTIRRRQSGVSTQCLHLFLLALDGFMNLGLLLVIQIQCFQDLQNWPPWTTPALALWSGGSFARRRITRGGIGAVRCLGDWR